MSGQPRNERDAPTNVAIVGIGRIGAAVAMKLSDVAEFRIELFDQSDRIRIERGGSPIDVRRLDAFRADHLANALRGYDAVIAALPDAACVPVARVAAAAGIDYIDFVEEPAVAAQIKAIARTAAGSFVPQCGVSPGLISQLTLDFIGGIARPNELQIRCGILPRHSTHCLGYGISWSVDGLIGEYTSKVHAIVGGKLVELAPLSLPEEIIVDGNRYEGFVAGNISGALLERLLGKIDTVVAKTIRYPGHLDRINFLLNDLKLTRRLDLLKNLLLNGLSEITDDRLLMLFSAGQLDQGRQILSNRFYDIRSSLLHGNHISSISNASASHAAAVLDLVRQGLLKPGFIAQEDIPATTLLRNRFLTWLSAG